MRIILFLTFFFCSNAWALTIPEGLEIDPRLKPYIKNWGINDTIIHFNNHINNNNRMLAVIIDDYFEYGIPEGTDLDGNKVGAVSAKQLRAHYGIPEEFWNDPHKKHDLKVFLSRFMIEKHDDAKLNTTKKFLEQHDEELPENEKFLKKAQGRRKVLQRKFIIENLEATFGENPWKIPEDASPEFKAQLEAAQKDIKFLNKIDDKVTDDYLKARNLISKDLSPQWVEDLLLKLEKTVDPIERWGNPVSVLEYKREMLPESKFTVKEGKVVERAPCLSSECSEFPSRRVLVQLEQNYPKISSHFDDYHKAVDSVFKRLESLGISLNDLDPIKRFEIIPLLQDGERSLPGLSTKEIKRILFEERAVETRELFKPGPNKSATRFEYLSIKERITNGTHKKARKTTNLFEYMSPSQFLAQTSQNDSSLKAELYSYVKINGRAQDKANLLIWGFNEFVDGKPVGKCLPVKAGVSK